MKIYTRNGDFGDTSIATGAKYHKSDKLIEALGSIDELNASMGLLHTFRNRQVKELVITIQNDLFSIGALLSNADISVDLDEKVEWLEQKIDLLQEDLPELKNFILPGGSRFSGHIHLSRSICRRAERVVVTLSDKLEYTNVIKYLNRLADLLFVLARYVNFKLGVKEVIWKTNFK